MAAALDKVRVILVGDSGVGKSSLTHLIAQHKPIVNPSWTVGCSVEVKLHEYKDGTPQQKAYFVELWDIGGSSSHRNTRSVFYNPVHESRTKMINVTKKNGSNSSPKTEPLTFLTHVKYEHLAAGILGGVTSTIMLHPLDLIKIRFAVNDGRTAGMKQYKNLRSAFTTIIRQEKIGGLYRGVTPNIWGAGTAWGFYFFFYNSLKGWFQDGDHEKALGPSLHMLAAAQAGVLTLAMTNPFWVVKTRLCLQTGDNAAAIPSNKRYSGMSDALQKIYRTEGIKGLYKGFVPGIFGVSHGALQFMCYEEMKNQYNKYRDVPINTKLATVEYLGFAASSKLFAAAVTYPYQVVRARLQDQHHEYKGSWDCIKRTYMFEGITGFYKGMSANLTRVVPATMITFLVYEKSSHFLLTLRNDGVGKL